MSMLQIRFVLVVSLTCWIISNRMLEAQPLGQPDTESPGDSMIQQYLARETARISDRIIDDLKSREEWEANRPRYLEEYYYMLGLTPAPEKTPLQAEVTGTVSGKGYKVELVHYQSRPGLYVTGNLYRPEQIQAGERLPAVFYVCGHSGRGRNGNKVAYQSHGIWFARHGYVCLVVDTLQLGEIAATHHGTYNLQRWWWHSRGYTPAGVEAWNGVRGIDYLISRPDVDAARIAVTGISGGGAATFWVTAADERVRVAVPVSGMADLEAYVPNRVINGHCDCMFLYNTFQWPWLRIAGLVAPRPMLFINSDQDRIFPMDANDRVIQGLERLYSQYGAGDAVDAVVSVGGHAYRTDIRQAAFRFINAHLKGDARPVMDSEIDIVSEGGNPGAYPIPPESLRVFPADTDLPEDQINTKIDEHFVPIARVVAPETGQFSPWKGSLADELRRVTFGYFPKKIPAAVKIADVGDHTERLRSESSIEIQLRFSEAQRSRSLKSVLLVVANDEESNRIPKWIQDVVHEGETVVICEPRGIGATRWTRKNPPNYVERSHVLLGRTVDTGRVWDVIAAAEYLADKARKTNNGADSLLRVAGKGAAGIIAAYAAILNEQISEVAVISPPKTHMEPSAPVLLNVLRVSDIPHTLGLIAPRPLTIRGGDVDSFEQTTAVYKAADASDELSIK
jgi:dienelactone hydrolase